MAAVASPVVPSFDERPATSGARRLRLLAMAAAGLSLGAIGSILTVTWVQAEGGGMDMLANARSDHSRREAARRAYYPTANPAPAPRTSYSGYVSSYAPAAPRQALSRTNDRGQITLPYLDLNPFRLATTDGAPRKPRKAKIAGAKTEAARNSGFDTVSGASHSARSICVRMCDGFHAPIGNLASASELPAHEALCKAMNPGVPVKVFRVPAGATSIDGAVAADGKTYGALSVAYSHEKTADPACRPKVVGFKERRISVLKDFTLRPGDTIVTETGARVFNGGSRYPFASADFRDFRNSELISDTERKRIDHLVGLSRAEQARRQARNALNLKEANASGQTATDVIYSLRGSFDETVGQQREVRVVQPSPFGTAAR